MLHRDLTMKAPLAKIEITVWSSTQGESYWPRSWNANFFLRTPHVHYARALLVYPNKDLVSVDCKGLYVLRPSCAEVSKKLNIHEKCLWLSFRTIFLFHFDCSPWYNRHDWLGVKNQLSIYLSIYLSIFHLDCQQPCLTAVPHALPSGRWEEWKSALQFLRVSCSVW